MSDSQQIQTAAQDLRDRILAAGCPAEEGEAT